MELILIVEDEPFIAVDLKFACEDCGIDAITAANVRQAMAAIDEHRFCGAILDVNLGRGETCEPVAEELSRIGVPFILNTGDLNRSGELVREFRAPIIAKPNDAAEVVRQLLAMAGYSQ